MEFDARVTHIRCNSLRCLPSSLHRARRQCLCAVSASFKERTALQRVLLHACEILVVPACRPVKTRRYCLGEQQGKCFAGRQCHRGRPRREAAGRCEVSRVDFACGKSQLVDATLQWMAPGPIPGDREISGVAMRKRLDGSCAGSLLQAAIHVVTNAVCGCRVNERQMHPVAASRAERVAIGGNFNAAVPGRIFQQEVPVAGVE